MAPVVGVPAGGGVRTGRDRAAGPGRAGAGEDLLWAAAKLADYAMPLGLEAVPEVLLHPSVIERFTRSAPGISAAARRTLRTNLRFVARRVAPYSAAQIAAYLALAAAQPTAARRM